MTRLDTPSMPSVDGVLQQSIHDIDIPPRPKIIDQIRAEMNSDAPNLRGIAGLINLDVSLAAGLIKTANSPYFGFGRRARSYFFQYWNGSSCTSRSSSEMRACNRSCTSAG